MCSRFSDRLHRTGEAIHELGKRPNAIHSNGRALADVREFNSAIKRQPANRPEIFPGILFRSFPCQAGSFCNRRTSAHSYVPRRQQELRCTFFTTRLSRSIAAAAYLPPYARQLSPNCALAAVRIVARQPCSYSRPSRPSESAAGELFNYLQYLEANGAARRGGRSDERTDERMVLVCV